MRDLTQQEIDDAPDWADKYYALTKHVIYVDTVKYMIGDKNQITPLTSIRIALNCKPIIADNLINKEEG